jgi:cytochrome c-type biogenesis protein CcmH
MIWLLFALMTGAAVLAALWPLGHRPPDRSANHDLAVYRDQLEEIERDRAAARIGAAEAEAARVEVSRRLIAAADASEAHSEVTEKPATVSDHARRLLHRRAAAVAALAVVPLFAAGLYLLLGSPMVPGQPLAERIAAAHGENSIAALLARVETHLAQDPDDGQGWEVIAPVYLRMQRFDDAVKARRSALRLLGETAARQSALGEALVAAADGVVTAEAKAAFERAVSLDAQETKAHFYLGLAAEQDGNRADAARIWRDMLAQAPADAPWISLVRQSLARVDPSSAVAANPPNNAPGPSTDDMAAAAQLRPEQRDQMIRGMVERLATRLHQDGSDVDGWIRLVRAYMVLGERQRARDAVSDAHHALDKEPDKIRRLEDGVKGFGLDG